VNRSGVWNCALAAVLFGAATPAASILARDIRPIVLAGLLYLGAALVVSPAWIRARPEMADLRRSWQKLAASIVIGGAIGPVLLVAGLTHTPAATASLLLNQELVATVTVSAVLFGEYLGRNMVIAATLVTVAGMMLVWGTGVSISAQALLIVGACVCWGIDNSITSRIDQITPQHVTFLKGIVAGSVNLGLGLLTTGAGSVGVGAIAGALGVGALGYGVSITMWIRGAQQLGAARGQVIFATAPFVGAVLSWLVLRESATMVQVAAMVVAGGGVAWSLRSSHEHLHTHEVMSHTHDHDGSEDHHEHVHTAGAAAGGRHTHVHGHRPIAHSHPHVPDLHHRHTH